MTTRLQDNQLKAIFFLILFIVLFLLSAVADAHSQSDKSEKTYTGLPTNVKEAATGMADKLPESHETQRVSSQMKINLDVAFRAHR